MLYGLGRLAQIVNDGVSKEDSYFMRCYNFEQLLEQMYQGKEKKDSFSIQNVEFLFLRDNRRYY